MFLNPTTFPKKEAFAASAGSENAPKVTTENTVGVVRENGYWLIRDVLGNKTAIDFPVAPESRIEAKPGEISPDNPDVVQ